MSEPAPKVYYSDGVRDKSLGRAPFDLCSLPTPGGRKLVDAFHAPRLVEHGPAEEDCPPWYWGQLLVCQTIRALRDAGWTVDPPGAPHA